MTFFPFFIIFFRGGWGKVAKNPIFQTHFRTETILVLKYAENEDNQEKYIVCGLFKQKKKRI